MQDTIMIPREQSLEERPVSRQKDVSIWEIAIQKVYQNDAWKKRVEVAQDIQVPHKIEEASSFFFAGNKVAAP